MAESGSDWGPTSLGGATYTWDSANRIASGTVGSTSSTFTYDGLSRLVRIVDTKGGAVVADRAFTWCGIERCAAHDNLQSGSPVVTRYFDEGVVDAGQSLYEVRESRMRCESELFLIPGQINFNKVTGSDVSTPHVHDSS